MKNTLALVLGTKTDWAVHTRKDGVISGTVDFSPKNEQHAATRWIAFRDWLASILNSHNIHAVFLDEEKPSGIEAETYGALYALLEIACYSHSCEIIRIDKETIKNFATSNALKDKQCTHATALLRHALTLDPKMQDAV